MKKRQRIIVAFGFALFSLLGATGSASAATCQDLGSEGEAACRAAATVVCKVVAKDRPCLN